jgi:hypothetical protein
MIYPVNPLKSCKSCPLLWIFAYVVNLGFYEQTY